MNRSRKALSPLVATAILLSAAMAGGIMLYQYFNAAMNNYTQEQNVLMSTLAQDTGTGKTLFYYSIKNTGTTSITLVKIDVYKGESVVGTVNLSNTAIGPGEVYSGTSVLNTPPSTGMYAVLTISVNGKSVVLKPVTVSLS
jgi:hypothetical protein